MSAEGLRLVEVEKSIHGLRLGIAHIPIVLDAFAINLNYVRKLVFYASENNVYTLITPYSTPYGPVIEAYLGKMRGEEIRRKYRIDNGHQYLKTLRYISVNYGINIVSPAVIEHAGNRHYISTLFVSSENPSGHLSQKKILLTSAEKNIGVRPGAEITVFNDYYLRYLVLISPEILTPELGRAGDILGYDVLIAASSPITPVKHYVDLVRALAVMLGKWVIHVGGVFIVDSDRYILNTMVVAPSGEVLVMYNEPTPGLVTIPFKVFKEAPSDSRYIETDEVLGFMYKYLRRHHNKPNT